MWFFHKEIAKLRAYVNNQTVFTKSLFIRKRYYSKIQHRKPNMCIENFIRLFEKAHRVGTGQIPSNPAGVCKNPKINLNQNSAEVSQHIVFVWVSWNCEPLYFNVQQNGSLLDQNAQHQFHEKNDCSIRSCTFVEFQTWLAKLYFCFWYENTIRW